MWVWRHYCTDVSFPVVEGENWVVWTMHCSLPVSGGIGDADGFGLINGATIGPTDVDLAHQVYAGLYQIRITETGTMTFTPIFDDAGGSSLDARTLLAHKISGPFDYVDCE